MAPARIRNALDGCLSKGFHFGGGARSGAHEMPAPERAALVR